MTNINKNINRSQKIYRSVKFIGKALKIVGTKESSKIALKTFSKANIATAAIDATLSVLDACNSFIYYNKEKEKTKQLINYIKSKQIEIENYNKEISSYIKGETLKIDKCYAFMEYLDNIREPILRALNDIQNLVMEEQKNIINLEKFETSNSKLIIALERFSKLTETQL